MRKDDDSDEEKTLRFGGSIRYMAPELLSVEEDDALLPTMATDIYSFGNIAYQVRNRTNDSETGTMLKNLTDIFRESPIRWS